MYTNIHDKFALNGVLFGRKEVRRDPNCPPWSGLSTIAMWRNMFN
jgi:hypothetical protein